MIKITYSNIYKLTPTPGVMQNMHPPTKNKCSKVPKGFLFLHSCKRREGSLKKKRKEKHVLKKHRKNICAQIKEHRKNDEA
jgi:hypothetical protein